MALIKPFTDEGTAADLLEIARRHYQDALEALEAVKRLLREDGEPNTAELTRVSADFRKATQTLFDERKRVEDQLRKEAGLAHGFGFDLDAARDEIGSKLDRLRAARSSGGVS